MKSAEQSRRSVALRNVEEIARLERDQQEELSLGSRISAAITRVAGTFGSALTHAIGFTTWMLWNSFGPQALRFDPYPFGFLTMFVSMEGVILAIFVLIVQNRMSAQSDQRDHLNLQVDLLAEQEMTVVLRLLSRIADRLGIEADDKERAEASGLMQPTNIYELMEELRRRL